MIGLDCLWVTFGYNNVNTLRKNSTTTFTAYLTALGISASGAWIDSTSDVIDNPNNDKRFKFTLSNDLTFALYDNGQLSISGQIAFINNKIFTSAITADTFISATTLTDGSLQVRVISGSLLGSFFSFLLVNQQIVSRISLKIMPQMNMANDNVVTPAPLKLKKILNKIDNLEVELFTQTDNFGLNLGEMAGIVNAEKTYPNGYPKDLIGVCKDVSLPEFTNFSLIQTCYSFRPKLSKVLKGSGDTLFAQTNSINKLYKTGLSDCDFFLNILAYCTYRYMLAGLSNNSVFSRKWLYANHYQQFLTNLKNSEFAAALPIFTEPQANFDFTNFNRYFKNCVK